MYHHSVPKALTECAEKLNKTMSTLEEWAAESNLLLNGKKTKQMVITTPQMSRVHRLDAMVPDVTVKGPTLERVKEFKLLGQITLNT